MESQTSFLRSPESSKSKVVWQNFLRETFRTRPPRGQDRQNLEGRNPLRYHQRSQNPMHFFKILSGKTPIPLTRGQDRQASKGQKSTQMSQNITRGHNIKCIFQNFPGDQTSFQRSPESSKSKAFWQNFRRETSRTRLTREQDRQDLKGQTSIQIYPEAMKSNAFQHFLWEEHPH